MGKFSLLYASIALKWNIVISLKRQGLETLKAVLKSICLFLLLFSFFETVLHAFIEVHLPVLKELQLLFATGLKKMLEAIALVIHNRSRYRLSRAKNGWMKILTILKNTINAFSHCIKVGSTPPKKNYILCFNEKPFKSDEKCFLFHLKSSFRSQDFVLSFCHDFLTI